MDDPEVALALEGKILAGCTPDLADCGSLSQSQAATLNEISTRPYRTDEKDTYPGPRVDGSDLPELCVAMSGGGLRSAAVSIGALQGLADLGLLSRVDLMSSVSGGSYASLWYHAHQVERLYRTNESTSLLQEGSPAQVALNSGRLFALNPFSIALEVVPAWLFNRVDTLPILGMLQHHSDQSAYFPHSSFIYQSLIDTFFTFDSEHKLFAWPLTWQDLAQSRPSFIINATAATTVCPPAESLNAFTNLLEMTPRRWGSRGLGFSWDRPDDVGITPVAAVAISGAATETPGPYCQVTSHFGLPLGAELAYFRDGTRWGAENTDKKDKFFGIMWGTRNLILSDGGGVDDSGVVSLIGRLCRRIVAIDASLPPEKSAKPENLQDNKDCWTLTRTDQRVLPESCAFEQLTRIVDSELSPAKLRVEQSRRPLYRMKLEAFPFPGLQPVTVTIDYLRLDLDDTIREGAIRILYEEATEAHNKEYSNDAVKFLSTPHPSNEFPWSPTELQAFPPGEFQAFKAVGRYLVHRYIGNLAAP